MADVTGAIDWTIEKYERSGGASRELKEREAKHGAIMVKRRVI